MLILGAGHSGCTEQLTVKTTRTILAPSFKTLLPTLEGPPKVVGQNQHPLVQTTAEERARLGQAAQPPAIATLLEALRAGTPTLIDASALQATLLGLDRAGLLRLFKAVRAQEPALLPAHPPRRKDALLAQLSAVLEARFTSMGAARASAATQLGVAAGLFPRAELAQIFSVVDPAIGALRYRGDGLDLHRRLDAAGIRTIAVRHGKTDANAKADVGAPVLCGQVEAKLTREGIAQAQACAQMLFEQLGGDAWLRRAADDLRLLPVIYASPLSRARETGGALVELLAARAEALTAAGSLPPGSALRIRAAVEPTIDPRLLEMNYGDLELVTLEAFRKEHADFAASWDAYAGLGVDFLRRFPGGESRIEVVDRVRELLLDVEAQHPGRTVLFFCHLETVSALKTAVGLTELSEGRLQVDAKGIANAVPHLLTSGQADPAASAL